jgi:hypothetical protein
VLWLRDRIRDRHHPRKPHLPRHRRPES